MSYEVPRAAKLKIDVMSKLVGKDEGKLYKAGKKVKVQRSPVSPGEFVIFFSANQREYAKVQALDLRDTIEYTDGRAEGVQ